MLRSVLLFVAAGICEIGGGYLVWRWWRDGAPWPIGLLGAASLVLYGVVPTYQHFGRVYAAYGGVFVVVSILWGWGFDGIAPNLYDLYRRAGLSRRRCCHHVCPALEPIHTRPF